MQVKLCIFMILIFHIYTINTIQQDPEPTGGAECINKYDCNNGGLCVYERGAEDDNIGFCECFKDRGNKDCSYLRKSKELVIGLQILTIIGIAGVGDFYAGNNTEALIQFLTIIPLTINLLTKVLFNRNFIENSIISTLYILTIGLIVPIGAIYILIRFFKLTNNEITDGNKYLFY